MTTHPLQNTWVVWHHLQIEKTTTWSSSMQQLSEFSSLESFYDITPQVLYPSLVFTNAHEEPSHKSAAAAAQPCNAISLFKRGIRPEWEDPANVFGSELVCRCSPDPRSLDLFWEVILLGLIGETIDPSDEVCGCRVVDKSTRGKIYFKLEVWVRSQDTQATTQVKENLLHRLGECVSPNHGLTFDLITER